MIEEFWVFLPKWISITEEDIESYNNLRDKNLHLIFKGISEHNKFKIDNYLIIYIIIKIFNIYLII